MESFIQNKKMIGQPGFQNKQPQVLQQQCKIEHQEYPYFTSSIQNYYGSKYFYDYYAWNLSYENSIRNHYQCSLRNYHLQQSLNKNVFVGDKVECGQKKDAFIQLNQYRKQSNVDKQVGKVKLQYVEDEQLNYNKKMGKPINSQSRLYSAISQKYLDEVINSHKNESEQKNIIRRKKVQFFLEKRKRRTFGKKISYFCRKEVADGRLRYQGRFINHHQAIQILSLDPSCTYPLCFLKEKIKSQFNGMNN